MTDPRRLLEGPSAGLAQQLLASADQDEPTAERAESWRRQLGLPLTALAATLAATAHASSASAVQTAAGSATVAAKVGAAASMGGLKSVGWLVAAKWTGVALLPVALGATVLASRAPTEGGAQPSMAVHAQASVQAPASAAPHATPASEVGVPVPQVSAPGPAARLGRSSAPKPAPSGPEPKAETLGVAPMLERELAQLDSARRALRRGNATLALIELERHAQAFPSSRLSDEATVLRISALASAGRASEATTLGQSFLRRRPNSPLAETVRAELQRNAR